MSFHTAFCQGTPVSFLLYKYRDRGVLPDYPVGYTIAEMMAGHDKEMELALSLIRAK
jgi:hypothetical protein